MIVNGIPIAVRRPGKLLSFSYSGGTYGYTEDGQGNWELRLFTSGVLTMNFDCDVDIFAVGGGGAGGSNNAYNDSPYGACGGGGGYTATVSSYSFSRRDVATAVIGAGGTFLDPNGETTKMYTGTNEESGTSIISAAGGYGGGLTFGGNGGSGGGGQCLDELTPSIYANGGTDGGNGAGVGISGGGTGQGTTTRAFGEQNGELFSGGGGGYLGVGGAGGGADGVHVDVLGNSIYTSGESALPNTGGGGGGGIISYATSRYLSGGAGGSGIIIIRNHR